MKCRFCKNEASHVFIDLVNSPASNSFLTKEQLDFPETFYPLKVYVCPSCFLVQVDEYKKSDTIFNEEYVYFSSFSKSWLKHAQEYTAMMQSRYHLNEHSLVMEVASNDGYLLQYFKESKIPVLGIEPTRNTAAVAMDKGIETIVDFFGESLASKLAAEGRMADVLLGNNVLAHVPDILDFVGGMQIVLKPEGVITMEFPHLLQLVHNNQFDTIYHEHFSYLSFTTVKKIFEAKGLRMIDVEELPTHGGSLRIYASHINSSHTVSNHVEYMLQKEMEAGMSGMAFYEGFQKKAFQIKCDFLNFLLSQKEQGKKLAGYGAAAKGNTLLNYCGVKNDLIDFVVDANPNKQGKYLPASHIPVVSEDFIRNEKPDFLILFPWNLKSELMNQLSYIREWGGKFVLPIPEVCIID